MVQGQPSNAKGHYLVGRILAAKGDNAAAKSFAGGVPQARSERSRCGSSQGHARRSLIVSLESDRQVSEGPLWRAGLFCSGGGSRDCLGFRSRSEGRSLNRSRSSNCPKVPIKVAVEQVIAEVELPRVVPGIADLGADDAIVVSRARGSRSFRSAVVRSGSTSVRAPVKLLIDPRV